ncbi:OmpP1/FadL family transporter [Alysiella filiformis DSM 16848]|nr:OmpP1/FadL family transporter [Alysiella filiformis]UBQ57360.1 OmpP1/FadL family transporter [Alysiella filiformis DSM 16848]
MGSSHAWASGYHFGTQSVTAQSTANAAGAEAADATTIFTNPAGLSKLDSHQITGAVNAVMPTIEYSNAQANHIGTERLPTGAVAVSGSTSGKITKNTVVAPHVYGAYKLSDDVTLGLGVYVPFGSETEYQKDSVLRYNMNRLGLKTIAIEPTIAFKANEQHAFGVGVVAQHTSAKLRKYADWGTASALTAANAVAQARANLASAQASGDATAIVAAGQALQAAGSAYQAAAANVGKVEGYAKLKGDDWGVGYHLGYLYDINDKARVGINYRSKVKHKLEGTANWQSDSLPASVLAQFDAAGYKASEKARVEIITPESASLQGMYRASDRVNLFGDVTWTRHSRFKEANLLFENKKNGTRDTTTITPNWRNTYRVALGGSYQHSEPLQLRAGVAFDQSPVRNASYRMNTLPDGNRVWFSLGGKYSFKKRHEIDLAYSHIHINDTRNSSAAADLTNIKSVDTKGASSANFKNYANIVGAQYTYRFK